MVKFAQVRAEHGNLIFTGDCCPTRPTSQPWRRFRNGSDAICVDRQGDFVKCGHCGSALYFDFEAIQPTIEQARSQRPDHGNTEW